MKNSTMLRLGIFTAEARVYLTSSVRGSNAISRHETCPYAPLPQHRP
jgi:hypothetical protein